MNDLTAGRITKLGNCSFVFQKPPPYSFPSPILTFSGHSLSSPLLNPGYAKPLGNNKHFKSVSCGAFHRVDKSISTPVKLGSTVKVRYVLGDLAEGDGMDDRSYIRRCVELARKAVGHTSPNPMVGCVIVKDGQVVGEGFHPKAGQPHAEVFALRDAGDLAEGSTAYVSLEPCNHHGRTPPCSEGLIKAKVKKVVIGMVDPNPIVSSKGIDKLRDAGIEVVVGVEEELCKHLNETFIHRMLTGKPFLTLRYSLSITNGRFVDRLGEGVTSSGSYYSLLLQEYDAVILPASLAEQSSSLVSHEPGANQPLQIFVASSPHSCMKLTTTGEAGASKIVIFAHKDAVFDPEIGQSGAEIVSMKDVDLNAILGYCGSQGLQSVLMDLRGNVGDLELLVRQAMDANLIQKVVVEVVPIWIEREDGELLAALSSLAQSGELKRLQHRTSKQSIVMEGYLY